VTKEPEFEAELEDIFEEISDKTIRGNIMFILKREKLWDKKLDIILPIGGFGDIDKENDSYQYDYEIWKDEHIIASGTCYGRGIQVEDPLGNPTGFEIIDMTLEICEGYKQLQTLCSKEKVEFT
jgi:hypothetical protein